MYFIKFYFLLKNIYDIYIYYYIIFLLLIYILKLDFLFI